MTYTYERKVNYYETDKMGVVHHSNYIRFLEEARCAYLDEIGLPYVDMEKRGVMIPVLEVSCTYKHPATFNDILIINLEVTDFTGVRMNVNYTLTDKATGNLVATATTKHCFTDFSLKPVNTKKNYPDIYEKYCNVAKK